MNTTLGPTDEIAQVAGLGRIVTVWAHPDDESYLAGGVMAIARWLGQAVTCITATSGDFADTDEARLVAGALRAAELEAALDVLGVDDRVQLDLGDGRCHAADEAAAVASIAAVLAERRPDTVITFGPDGFTGHDDHRAVSRWTSAAVAIASPAAQLLFATATPAIHALEADVNERFSVFDPGLPTLHDRRALTVALRLDAAWLDRKLSALRAHASQTTHLIDAIGLDRYRTYVAHESLIDAHHYRPDRAVTSGVRHQM